VDWREDRSGDEALEGDYEVGFGTALFTVLKRLGLIFMVPRTLLGRLPFQACKETYTAFIDFTKYMQTLQTNTLNRIDEVSTKTRKNILESIVLAGADLTSQVSSKPLPEGSVLGNIFFTLMAGHETTGNSLAFAVILLAIYPEHQDQIQKELDRILGDRPTQEWTSDFDYQALNNGYLGAVLKEVLRTYNVV
jgi:cytochrome P450